MKLLVAAQVFRRLRLSALIPFVMAFVLATIWNGMVLIVNHQADSPIQVQLDSFVRENNNGNVSSANTALRRDEESLLVTKPIGESSNSKVSLTLIKRQASYARVGNASVGRRVEMPSYLKEAFHRKQETQKVKSTKRKLTPQELQELDNRRSAVLLYRRQQPSPSQVAPGAVLDNTTGLVEEEHFNATAVSHYLLQEPTGHACDGYDGVLYIQSGDMGAAAGTAFFQYVINQIIFARHYNLVPWIHFNHVSQHVYDPAVHEGVNTSLVFMTGMKISWKNVHRRARPAPLEPGAYPYRLYRAGRLVPNNYTVSGNGVWEMYFEPVSDIRKGDTSCEALPIVAFTYEHLTPGMHLYAPWAVRSWEYMNMPLFLKQQDNQTQLEWFEPMRRKAHSIVQEYYRFQPHIIEAANRVLPPDPSRPCMAMHIRHSDKWGARRQIPATEFLPYVKAFLKNGGRKMH